MLQLEDKGLNFIWKYGVAKLREIGNILELSQDRNKAELLCKIVKTILEPKEDLILNVVNKLMKENDNCEDHNLIK